jgi:hypothetical protein
MSPALRAFLGGIVDYAGLFPPAQLPLEPAIRNYVRYSNDADAWMLGRFVIPAARLADLEPLGPELFQSGLPVLFSALGRGGATTAEFVAGVDSDLAEISHFRQSHGAGVLVDGFEVRLPPDAVGDGLPALLDPLLRMMQTARLTLYLEPPRGADRDAVATVAGALAGRRGVGLKLRCGGATAADFPSVETVAGTLIECAVRAVPLKATAGLHHPLPRFDAAVGARMHGFVNLFAAGMLAAVCGVGEETVAEALSDEDPARFVFGEEGLRWRDHTVPVPRIAAARRDAFVSFGSCSFDEPRADLRALGWL